MKGCSTEAVSWKTSVMIPIWAKLRPSGPLMIG